MNAFRVSVRLLGGDCRVRVDGMENARWLLDRLSQCFVFKSCEPISQEAGSSCCTFQVAYDPRWSLSKFEKLLAAIPEVQLMSDPA